MYRSLALKHHDTNDNFVFSPFGVTLSLLKLYHGLDQHVTAQLADALHLTGLDDYDVTDDVIDKMNDVVGSLAKLDDSNDLWLNSQLFYDKSMTLVENILLNEEFQEAPAQLDFSNADDAAAEIDKWIADVTDDVIAQANTTLSDGTSTVVAHALSVTPHWDKKFSQSQTKHKKFTLNDGTTVSVPMMHQTGNFFYKDIVDYDVKLLMMPTVSRQLNLCIFLLPQGTSANKFEGTDNNLCHMPD